jgi:hypothetical protein
MATSDTKIHQIELLLTLDYLLTFTDEKHPATQQKICSYIRKLGPNYDLNPRRQRIGECLSFIDEASQEFGDRLPFVLGTTDGGKYYIESKNYLSEDQITEVIAAIRNDKYTDSKETNNLIELLLDAFSTSETNRKEISGKALETSAETRKYSSRTMRKIVLVRKAFSESKSIKIRVDDFEFDSKGQNPVLKTVDRLYRVYAIKEYQNKPFAILVPLNGYGVFCSPIADLNIPTLPEREILWEDEKDRDLDQLFKSNNKKVNWGSEYTNISDYIKDSKRIGGMPTRCLFYFKGSNLDEIKASFEEFFSCQMSFAFYSKVSVNYDEKVKTLLILKDEKKPLTTEPFSSDDQNGVPPFIVVDMKLGYISFFNWIVSNPVVESEINVVLPTWLNEKLADYYIKRLNKYKNLKYGETIEIIHKRRG